MRTYGGVIPKLACDTSGNTKKATQANANNIDLPGDVSVLMNEYSIIANIRHLTQQPLLDNSGCCVSDTLKVNYQLVDDDTTPPKVLSPVYAPARVIVPGTKIPVYVILDEKVEVAVVFGIWI